MTFFQENFSLTSLNTFGIAAKASYFWQTETLEELLAALDQCRAKGVKWHILGGGSNTIFMPSFAGAVIHLSGHRIELQEKSLVVCQAGMVWDQLVEWSVAHGLAGLENLSAIPGTVGASGVQNIGAYGVEAADKIVWIEYLDPTLNTVHKIDAKDCDFAYRHSIFKDKLSHCIVLRVAYGLKSDAVPADFDLDYGALRAEVEKLGALTSANVRQAVMAIRAQKLPDPKVMGNAGSFFKNPVVDSAQFEALIQKFPSIAYYKVEGGVKIPAGWLIDKAGLKGVRSGAVGTHSQQALVIVNHGGATADEILAFAKEIEHQVFDKFGITLEKEVTIVQ
ncbi:MAG: UDP-N-acetylmuramate dehydrogenase [Mucinivorans sp.]